MAEITPSFNPFKRRLLSIAITSVSALAAAETAPARSSQWECLPAGDGWQCQQKERAPGAYPLAPMAKIPPGKSGKTAAKARDKTLATVTYAWDWVPKSQLKSRGKDPSLCDTGCDGAYVAPAANWPDADQSPDTAPVQAAAATSRLVDNVATLSGDVVFSQGYRRLTADQASLDRNNNLLVAEGNIELREPNLLIQASRAELNTESSLGYFEDARFLQHDNQLRGGAQLIERRSADTLDLEQAMVTHCPPQDETWKINASRIHLDEAEGWGSASHSRLNIEDIPVLYIPYMTFPIDERRKTGLLWPTLGTSSGNGFEISTPYYLNLAPNYDATIAPRYIEKRGIMTELELRQLSSFGHWILAGAYLVDDQYVAGADPVLQPDVPPQEKRWIGNVQHDGGVGLLHTSIDYTKVSDNDFFHDLSTDSLELKRTSHLSQRAALGLSTSQWRTELIAQDYQTIDEALTDQYQLLPRLSIERYRTGANFELEWLFNGEFTQFDHNQSWDDGGHFTTGERTFGEVGASFPMSWAAGFLTPMVKLRHIDYNLDATAVGADESPNVTSALGTLDMGLFFERNAGNYLQTLEPRLYYLYSDYQAQTANPLFDTRELDFSYNQLFRNTRFSGHDRLDDANQVSVGLTSRFIKNTNGREVISLSAGQIFYFEDRRVQLGAPVADDQFSNSLIATEIQYQPRDNLWLSNTLLWDSHRDLLQEGGLSVHYQTEGSSLYNLGYRFRRDDANIVSAGTRDLSQVDASAALPLTDRWELYARYRYDIEEHRAMDDMFGLRYEDCCWAVTLLYQRGIDNEYLNATTGDPVVEKDQIFVLEFQLKGLGSLGSKVQRILSENILGYEDLEH